MTTTTDKVARRKLSLLEVTQRGLGKTNLYRLHLVVKRRGKQADRRA